MSQDSYGWPENSQDHVSLAPQETGGVHTGLDVIVTNFLYKKNNIL